MDRRAAGEQSAAKRRRVDDGSDTGAAEGATGDAFASGGGSDLASRLLAALGQAAPAPTPAAPAPPPPTDRERWRAAFPAWVTPAAPVITVRVGAAEPWHPAFTHQCFDGEVVFGWRAPRLAIAFDDPAMATVSALWEHDGRIDDEAVEVSPGVPPPRADDLTAALKSVLPDGVELTVRRRLAPGAGGSGEAAAPVARLPHAALFAASSAGGARLPGVRVAEYARGADRFTIHRWCIAGDDDAGSDAPVVGAGAGSGGAGGSTGGERGEWTRAYHDALSTLAICTIENASPIDVADARWSVYVCFHLPSAAASASSSATEAVGGGGAEGARLVGYTTVYRFTNPFSRGRPDFLRLSQLVVLPAYQRQRHGWALMEAVYAEAVADGSAVEEVAVEDPCDGMQRLRDALDVQRAVNGACFAGWEGWEAAAGGAGDGSDPAESFPDSLLQPVKAAALRGVRTSLRITVKQAHRVHEALLLAQVQRWADRGAADDAVEEAWRRLRLAVKRRVLEADEDLQALGERDPEARKEALEQAWRAAAAEYAAAGGTVRTPSVPPGRDAQPLLTPSQVAAVRARVGPVEEAGEA